MGFAQLATGVLGVLLTAGEYPTGLIRAILTGLIRAILTAVPRRPPVLWSRTAIHVAVLAVVSTTALFVSFLCGESILAGTTIALGLSDGGVLRCLAGGGVYLALVVSLTLLPVRTDIHNTPRNPGRFRDAS
ncbi:MAG: hypothetical protein HKP61_18170 [Dactylosporangium sp.]|nr:hypothetical protein [Dactylosporangium sp.]NNJ62824.1 hypothetical protein [Dactylosporangium sp.]